MSIEVRQIEKNFGSFAALKGVSLDFPSGELVALCQMLGIKVRILSSKRPE